MKLFKKILIIGFCAVVLAVGAWLLTRLPIRKEPMTWTRANALIPVNVKPEISDEGGAAELMTAIDNSLRYLKTQPASKCFVYGPDTLTKAQVIGGLEEFRAQLAARGLTPDFFEYIRDHFTFYKSAAESVLFTGYYESLLRGSRTPGEKYRFPLYRTPPDLLEIELSQFSFYKNIKNPPKNVYARLGPQNKILPYYTRDEIDFRGALAGKNLEFVWSDSLTDVFFLQIQGSGVIVLENGERMRVNYAGKNGHPYRAIGQFLVEKKALKPSEVSMQSIRQYLETHPEEQKEIFNYNPSYVFFREVSEGPIGCLGVPVTGMRSIASDRSLMPEGGLCFLETELPVLDENGIVKGWRSFRGFLLNQDTGGAITSPGRIDIFTGGGPEAEATAGYMQQTGMFYFLVKK